MFERGDPKQTRFYQEIREESIAEERERLLLLIVPGFLRLGLSAEQIAQELDVEVQAVERIIQQQQLHSELSSE